MIYYADTAELRECSVTALLHCVLCQQHSCHLPLPRPLGGGYKWPGRKWRAGHLPFVPPSTASHSINLTNNQTSTSQISLHEPHHIYRPKSIILNDSFNLQYLCLSVYPILHSIKCVRGQGHELQIWKHWKMDQMIIALCFTVSQKQGSSSGQSVDTSQSAADHQFRLPGLRRTFCQSLELLLAGEGRSWRVKPAK